MANVPDHTDDGAAPGQDEADGMFVREKLPRKCFVDKQDLGRIGAIALRECAPAADRDTHRSEVTRGDVAKFGRALAVATGHRKPPVPVRALQRQERYEPHGTNTGNLRDAVLERA